LYFLKKSFKVFYALVNNGSGIKIKCLKSNRGDQFTSNDFNEFYEKHGIKRQLSVARTPQQNGVRIEQYKK